MSNLIAYNSDYYRRLTESARRSAAVVVPLVKELIQPQCVVDVGCGLGVWLAAFQESGVTDVLGIDGDHVDPAMLAIPRENFRAHDLRQLFSLDRSFDLVMSLEVAEHLPKECSQSFIDCLTSHGSVVLFSAAIPGQGGEDHVNEQWPGYWAELFEHRGFHAVDALRAKVWDNTEVAWWYAQNMLLYVRRDRITFLADADKLAGATGCRPLPLVHPRLLQEALWRERVSRASAKLNHLLPANVDFLLVDQDQFGVLCLLEDRRPVPFPMRDGAYGGPPADANDAVEELKRRRGEGASYIVFGWPAHWWLDHYARFRQHLDSRYELCWRDDDLVVYDLCV